MPGLGGGEEGGGGVGRLPNIAVVVFMYMYKLSAYVLEGKKGGGGKEERLGELYIYKLENTQKICTNVRSKYAKPGRYSYLC